MTVIPLESVIQVPRAVMLDVRQDLDDEAALGNPFDDIGGA